MTRRLGFILRAAAALCWMAGALSACKSPAVNTVDDHFAPGELLASPAPLPYGGHKRLIVATALTVTKQSEGWEPRVYEDAARYCTIGYGHLIKRAPCDGHEPPAFRAGLTEPAGSLLLLDDMSGTEYAVGSLVRVPMTDGAYGALCDFTFNVGAANFRKSTVLVYVNANRLDLVPDQLRRWVKAGGRAWPGLRTRREREIALFLTGQPWSGTSPPPGPPPINGPDLRVTTGNLAPIDIRIGE